MSHNTLAMYDNVYPIMSPVDLGTTGTSTVYIDLLGVSELAFLVNFGVVTDNASTDIIEVTVDACSIENAGAETAVVFNYRKSSAPASNTWGAVTTATATGAYITDDESGMSLWIDVDVDTLAASKYRYARVFIQPNDMTVCLASVIAFINSRYHMTTMYTSTACASS